ncbi:hypothetical protein MNBD_GAMMA16-627, partial [hydrothermal vent metagenome]
TKIKSVVPTNTIKNSKLLFLSDFMFTPCEVGLRIKELSLNLNK